MPSTLPLSRPLTTTTSFTSTTSTASTSTHLLTTHTSPPNRWTYIHLALHTTPPSPAQTADALSLRQRLTAALTQHLGAHGAAVPVDVLKMDGGDAWVRVPREDGAAVIAAVGAWVGVEAEGERRVGMAVRGWGEWLAAVALGGGCGGQDVFSG
ncbi:hypothetical protein GTA08_BOTSDO00065 [Botryosphaeria dothidea]|uniref:Ribonucleases P/MRP subunit Pop8-like domain-containing protein n=1 Tax=Botryosphaeria dothidea TaxID=55169 RepID=A0A8H4N9M9_9PEZI|nr:hypothetical protein GTA08_BOTSDO00065 [Botryosphaeria dothidea]